MEQKTIGIIGSNGKFGKWLERFFIEQGCPVIGSDLGTKLSNRQIVERADVVIFSVPISKIVVVVTELVPASRPDQLWMDVTGVKVPAIRAMLQSSAEVIGLHPMCAPTIRTFRGQTVVVHKARVTDTWEPWFDEFILRTQAIVKLSTPEEHDRYVAIVQGMQHAMNLVMAHTIRTLEVNISESMEYTSPFYRIALSLMGRLLGQGPEVYADMQIENPHVVPILKALECSLVEFRKMIESRNKNAFIANFIASRNYFGDEQIENASRFFDDLIRFRANLAGPNMIEIIVNKDRLVGFQIISGLFAEVNINLTSFHSQKLGDGKFRFLVGFENVKNSPEIQTIISKIREMPGFEVVC